MTSPVATHSQTGRMPSSEKPKSKVRILVADREAIFRIGLKKLLSVEDDLRVVAQADEAGQVPSLVKKFNPHILFIQKEILQEGPGDLLDRLYQLHVRGRVVIMASSLSDDDSRMYTLKGAAGVILKTGDPEEFIRCVRQVHQKEHWAPKNIEAAPGKSAPLAAALPVRPVDTLTSREKSILSCLLQGWRNREIAKHLTITEQTVKNHLRTIFDKIGVSDRLELVLYAIHHRLELPPVG